MSDVVGVVGGAGEEGDAEGVEGGGGGCAAGDGSCVG